MKAELPIKIGFDRALGSDKINRPIILGTYIFKVLPQVKRLLCLWENEAQRIPDPILRGQALDSLHNKAFHCQGGAVYAVPGNTCQKAVLHFIVAYQTLCDYLDNLCDRVGSTDGQAFEQLHQALFDALDPGQNPRNYYQYYPLDQDGDYINKLVRTCQACLYEVSGYYEIKDEVYLLARLYSDLQVKKHLGIQIRHGVLSTWAAEGAGEYDGIMWPEYSAACGSTLAIFALLKHAMDQDAGQREIIEQTYGAYFPWINGLHILLDYFIDRSEDREGGDLNFTFYYESEVLMRERLEYFTQQAMHCADKLHDAVFHRTVVHGLLAMYLSDQKIGEQGYEIIARKLLAVPGAPAWRTYHLCRIVRKFL